MAKKIVVGEGQKFNRLTIVREVEERRSAKGNTSRMIMCTCDCGNEVVCALSKVRSGHTKSCGCSRVDAAGVRKIAVEAGDKYNRLTVIREVEGRISRKGVTKRRVLCECSCGAEKEIEFSHIRNGTTKSCGCLQREKAIKTGKSSATHGLTLHRAYGTWHSMISRCTKPRNARYKRYGGRGITVCDEWAKEPTEFCKWCDENGFKKGLQIDRKNNNLGYSPDNCRFVTPVVNSQNTNHCYYWYIGEKRFESVRDAANSVNLCTKGVSYRVSSKNYPMYRKEKKYKENVIE